MGTRASASAIDTSGFMCVSSKTPRIGESSTSRCTNPVNRSATAAKSGLETEAAGDADEAPAGDGIAAAAAAAAGGCDGLGWLGAT
jgi:hypothetical protein